jgi:cytochrome c-type biogenesis protein
MENLIWGTLSALWLGILTSISPCPLTTNIAAISFVGRRIEKPVYVFLSGVLYTLGRTLAYVVLGALLVSSLLSAPLVSHFLQKYMNKLLGLVLIVVGMFLMKMIRLTPSGGGMSDRMQKRVEVMGIPGAFLLGILLALAFCPVSAALFFGSLTALSVQYNSRFLLPFVYGVGTALPVIVFAVLLALGAKWVGRAFNRLIQVEKWFRMVTGAIFVLVGIYLVLVHIYRVFA